MPAKNYPFGYYLNAKVFNYYFIDKLFSSKIYEDTAKVTQLMMEYDLQPPFNSDTPDSAETQIVESLLQEGKPLIDAFKAQTQSRI